MMQYKWYIAKTTLVEDPPVIFGEVIGVRHVITFEGRTVEEARQAFHDSVDLYLETCDEEGIEPDQPFSGRSLVRTEPSIHRLLVSYAKATGTSVNALINQILVNATAELPDLESLPSSAHGRSKRTPSATRRKVASRPASRRAHPLPKRRASG